MFTLPVPVHNSITHNNLAFNFEFEKITIKKSHNKILQFLNLKTEKRTFIGRLFEPTKIRFYHAEISVVDPDPYGIRIQ